MEKKWSKQKIAYSEFNQDKWRGRTRGESKRSSSQKAVKSAHIGLPNYYLFKNPIAELLDITVTALSVSVFLYITVTGFNFFES